MSAGVALSDWRIDDAFADAFSAAERTLARRRPAWRLMLESHPESREDNPGWKLDRFTLTAHIHAEKPLPAWAQGAMGAAGLRQMEKNLLLPAWQRWIRR